MYEVLTSFVSAHEWPLFRLVSSYLMVKFEDDSVYSDFLFLGDLILATAFSWRKVSAGALEGFFSEGLREAL